MTTTSTCPRSSSDEQAVTTALPARAPRLRGARALFTTRDGGVSAVPFDELNLARHVGDADDAVTANREIVAGAIGAPLVFVDQVHSAAVHVLPPSGAVPVVTADALVTDRDDVALAIMVADCMPVLLSDPVAGVIGAAHAGRPGLLAGVLESTLAAMQQRGALPDRIEVAVGPSACGACYEVPQEMADAAARQLPAVRSRTSWGTHAIDLRAGAVEALGRAGVPPEAIDVEAPCTIEDPIWFSYRRAKATGRFAGVIRRA